jgi:TolB protein
MRKSLFVMAALMAFSLPAQAEGMLDWLDSAGVTAAGQKTAETDAATLLTLEPGENEMYAKPSPDGKFLLTVVNKGKRMWISRRYAENGDPAGVVTEDPHAFDSVNWRDQGHVYFLSDRAGGLGLWEKIADGEGMQRRLLNMRGTFTEPILLSDGSVVAVRLSLTEPLDQHHSGDRIKNDAFDNWSLSGYRAELVHISPSGDEQMLSEGINPALSPDGKWIAFSMPAGRSYHLFRMHPDGSELIQVTDARSVDVQPAWSPDGKWIVFTSNRQHADMRHNKRSNWDIWAIDPAGRNLTQLTMDAARDGGAEVGANGRVYFHSDRKIDAQQTATRGVSRAQQGFHIWSLPLPSTIAHGQ